MQKMHKVDVRRILHISLEKTKNQCYTNFLVLLDRLTTRKGRK
jgi:hypothetical protein